MKVYQHFNEIKKSQKRKVIFLDRDGTINVEKHLLHKVEDMELYPDSAKAIKKINDSEFLVIVITNQPVVARGLCSIEELGNIHNCMVDLLAKENAVVDQIYFCPHHPEKGFPDENPDFKIPCTCRKPDIGMIEQAVKDFDIDLNESFFIGDSYRDIECGEKAGVTTVGVRTGYGCKDKDVRPEYLFSSLNEAINFIVDSPYKKYCDEIIKKIVSDKRIVVSVAGNSRSGKSSFAKYLSQYLTKQKISNTIISFDDWIIDKEKRSDDSSVFENFQVEKLVKDLEELLNKNTITLKPYNPFTRKASDNEKVYDISESKIIIFDGVIVNSDERLRKMTDFKIFMDVDEETQRLRINDFYSWKGLNKPEIEKLYKFRQKTEYSIIVKDKDYSDLIING